MPIYISHVIFDFFLISYTKCDSRIILRILLFLFRLVELFILNLICLLLKLAAAFEWFIFWMAVVVVR